jgi:hypothetical protein
LPLTSVLQVHQSGHAMRRNLPALAAFLILIIEFGVPFLVETLDPESVRALGPGGPYIALYWLFTLSAVGILLGCAAVLLSFRGRGSRIFSVIVLALHLLIFAVPAWNMLRLVMGWY